MAILSDEQVETVRRFFMSEAADVLFQHLEQGLVTNWINSQAIEEREECWRTLQALLQLKFSLRDAAAMKTLTQRAQERRVYQS